METGAEAPESIPVEVAHARPDRQVLLALAVRPGTTVGEAIELSDIRSHFPDLEVREGYVGVFSRKVKLGDTLRAGDRIEIYRPLLADPKDVRRKRAEGSKT